MKERVVLWGMGKIGKMTMTYRWAFQDSIEIVAAIDSNELVWNKCQDGVTIHRPDALKEFAFDKVVITSEDYFTEIEKQLVEEFDVDKSRIENFRYFAKVKLLARYKESQDMDIKKIVDFLGTNKLAVFNYQFVENYSEMKIDIDYDVSCGLFYVVRAGKRMYMARRYNTKNEVYKYYRQICVEQDRESPHRYLDAGFGINKGDIVLDIGAAEGYFSLSVIERASKIYLIETDKEWIEALRHTFSEYNDKITILNKFISDYTYFDTDTLDNLIDTEVDFIKMDIEGTEVEGLRGAQRVLTNSKKIKCAICAYHRDNDEAAIRKMMESIGFRCKATGGYMYFPMGGKQLYFSPVLRRGVIRCEK